MLLPEKVKITDIDPITDYLAGEFAGDFARPGWEARELKRHHEFTLSILVSLRALGSSTSILV